MWAHVGERSEAKIAVRAAVCEGAYPGDCGASGEAVGR